MVFQRMRWMADGRSRRARRAGSSSAGCAGARWRCCRALALLRGPPDGHRGVRDPRRGGARVKTLILTNAAGGINTSFSQAA